jgi:hypothetical protein
VRFEGSRAFTVAMDNVVSAAAMERTRRETVDTADEELAVFAALLR